MIAEQTAITHGAALLLLIIIGALAFVAMLWAWYEDQAAHEDREADRRLRESIRRYGDDHEVEW